ncbi:MAG: hypothetical protein RL885_31490 [Planctomycetota bacterium]
MTIPKPPSAALDSDPAESPTYHDRPAIASRAARIPFLSTLLAAMLATPMATAQVDFRESFENVGPADPAGEGPQNLIAAGWLFRNQSDQESGPAWYDGTQFGGTPFEGNGYLEASSQATDWFGGAMSTWAILPDLPGLQAGDIFSLWVYSGGSTFADTHIEIRLSPSGQTSTGQNATDVGDFTQLLFSAELPISEAGYRQIVIPLPRSGRLAFRYRSPYIMTAFGRGAILSVDALTVGPAPGPPCGVPIPLPGQIARWTVADSPYTICQDLTIPEGGRVIVEPGVTVTFGTDNELHVEGELFALGIPGQPIIFNGVSSSQTGIVTTGETWIEEALLSVPHRFSAGQGNLQLRRALVPAGGLVEGYGRLAVIEDCLFRGGLLGGTFGLAASLRVARCDLSQGSPAILQGLVYLDQVTLEGAPLVIERENVSQPTFVNRVSVTNYTSGAGLRVRGANYLLGPAVTTQGNLYPLEIFLTGGGLLEGSQLPKTGNQNNEILAGELLPGAGRYWADTGVPYVVSGFPDNRGGSLRIGPGAEVLFQPNAGAFFVTDGAQLFLDGTRENPVRLGAKQPGLPWFGLKLVDNFRAMARNAVFEHAQIALQSDGGRMRLEDSIFQNCEIGTFSVTGGLVRARHTQFLGNDVGMTTTSTGRIDGNGTLAANRFVGNGIAVDNHGPSADLDQNWWNSPTGPTSPNNPGGTGDPVDGLPASSFTPFRTSDPSFADEAPRVELEPIFFTAQVGDKILLRWSAEDDSSIAAQRIEFAPYGFTFQTIASLGPLDRSFEFIAPIIPPSSLSTNSSAIRIVVTDDSGQDWWSERRLWIPYQEDWTSIERTIAPIAPVVDPAARLEVCWSPSGTADAFLLFENEDLTSAAGGSSDCLPIGARMPWMSTDRARVALRVTFGAGGRESWYFSNYFAVRPDERYGDAPPKIELVSPRPGEKFVGGGTIPVAWEASDDEGLRSFRIQASYDGGRTWHSVARDIPSFQRFFEWKLPASSGIADVRVRVAAVDRRFQTSSDTIAAPISIRAGDCEDCGHAAKK